METQVQIVTRLLHGKYINFGYQECDHDFFQKNREEIGETAEVREVSLKTLKHQLNEVPDCCPRLDDIFLLRFLRVCKFNCTRALERIQRYYAQKDRVVDKLSQFTMPLTKAESMHHVCFCPYRPPDNSTLVFMKAGIDYTRITFEDRFYLDLLGIEELLEYPVNQMCGITIVVDYEGFDFHGVLAYPPWKTRFDLGTFQSMGARAIKCHVLNSGPIAFLIKLALPLLSQKIRSRVQFHSRSDGYKSLHSELPLEVLPEKYGGQLKDSDMIYLEKWNFKELDRKFSESLKFGYTKHRQKRESFQVIQ